jgi:hypothetical protein
MKYEINSEMTDKQIVEVLEMLEVIVAMKDESPAIKTAVACIAGAIDEIKLHSFSAFDPDLVEDAAKEDAIDAAAEELELDGRK